MLTGGHPMLSFRMIQCAIVATFLLLVAASTQAVPIKFEFTGTVTDKILSYGEYTDVWLHARKWKGKTVTGQMVMDIEGLELYPNLSPDEVYYSSSVGNNPSDFISFTLTNPDGNTYSFPGDYDPLPEVAVDGGTAYLIDSFYNGTHFFADKVFTNSRSAPRQVISLRMQASGANAKQTITSMDFNTVEFHPEFANVQNYGSVEYIHDNGKRFDYYFTINSITRVPISEPSSLILIFGGLVGLLVCRQHHLKTIFSACN
jgi:hypothetical protein